MGRSGCFNDRVARVEWSFWLEWLLSESSDHFPCLPTKQLLIMPSLHSYSGNRTWLQSIPDIY